MPQGFFKKIFLILTIYNMSFIDKIHIDANEKSI